MEIQPTLAKNQRTFTREIIETLLLIIAIYTLVNLVTSRYMVDGKSMLPSFEGGEFLIVNRFEYMLKAPQRGDIVIFHYPNDPSRDFIKRVIGLPGETVHLLNGQVFVDGVALDEPYTSELCNGYLCRDQETRLGDDEFFVLGDNRNASEDSSAFGPVHRRYIVGRAWITYWPPKSWGSIPHRAYENRGVTLPSPTPTATPPAPMSSNTG